MAGRRTLGLVALFVTAAAGLAYIVFGGDDKVDRTPVVRSAPVAPPPPALPQLPQPVPAAVASASPIDAGPCGPDMEHYDEVESDGTLSSGCGKRVDGNRLKEGRWTMRDTRNFTMEGQYADGLREGRWTAWYPSGSLFQYVEFVHGKKNGVWVQWSEDHRKLFEHAYVDDELDGASTDYFPDGRTETVEWKRGVRVGP